jgi:hypothetical protein
MSKLFAKLQEEFKALLPPTIFSLWRSTLSRLCAS